MVYFISQTVLLQGMLFNIVIEAFGELRNKEMMVERDKKEICYICGIDKVSCEKNGKKFEEHVNVDHNIWTYVEYILGLKFVDVQETNAINSYVVEKIEEKSLSWFPRNNE
jgi:inositol 1,4,5-triphosphate receptor type 1